MDRVISRKEFESSKRIKGAKLYSKAPFEGKPELAEEFNDCLVALKQIAAEGGYHDVGIRLQ